MLHHEQTKSVNSKVMEAEKTLVDYFKRADYDPARQKVLVRAVQAARQEFFDRMEAASPEKRS